MAGERHWYYVFDMMSGKIIRINEIRGTICTCTCSILKLFIVCVCLQMMCFKFSLLNSTAIFSSYMYQEYIHVHLIFSPPLLVSFPLSFFVSLCLSSSLSLHASFSLLRSQ